MANALLKGTIGPYSSGGESNVKWFSLTSLSDIDALQEVINFCAEPGCPIITYEGKPYVFSKRDDTGFYFYNADTSTTDNNNGTKSIDSQYILIYVNDFVATSAELKSDHVSTTIPTDGFATGASAFIPTDDKQPTSKKYVDDSVSGKLDKIAATDYKVYGTTPNGQDAFTVRYEHNSNSIMSRDANGNTQVGTPINERDATNKKYVDNAVDKVTPKWGSITGTLSDQTDLYEAIYKKVDASELGTTAFSNEYDDLNNTPTIGEGTITIKQNDEVRATFNANANDDVLVELNMPTKVSELANDANYISSYTETDPTVPSYVKSITANNISSWNGKYSKPSNGIPKTDLASAVQTSLGKADTSLQPGDLNGYATRSELKSKQDAALVTSLDAADDEHYPSAKAVADALIDAGGGDMMSSMYDPNKKQSDVYNAQNQYNLDDHLDLTSEKAVQNKVIAAKINEIELSKFPNASIIGEPTIIQGNVSGFSADNYLQFPFIMDLYGKGFQIDFVFTTGTDVTTQQNVIDSKFGLALAIKDGKGLMAISNNGTSWASSIVGSIAIQPNTTYYARLSWNKLQYKTALSTDGVTYTDDMVVTNATRPYPTTTFIGGCSGSVIGHAPHPFGGTINMNKAYMYINNQLIWQGMDDAGLATRADISLSNLDQSGEDKLNRISRVTVLEEGVDYTAVNNATKSPSPRSTSYGSVDITITKEGVEWREGNLYLFIVKNFPGTSTYRNIRVRIGEEGTFIGIGSTSSVSAGYTYFTKATGNLFKYTTAYYETGALHNTYVDTNTTYAYLVNSFAAGNVVIDSAGYGARYSLIFPTTPIGSTAPRYSSLVKSSATGATKACPTIKFYADRHTQYVYTANIAAGAASANATYQNYTTHDLRYTHNYASANFSANQRIFLWLEKFNPDDYSFETSDTTNHMMTENKISTVFPSTTEGDIYLWYLGQNTATLYTCQPDFEALYRIYKYTPSTGVMIPFGAAGDMDSKQDVIEDLDDIRAGARKGATALQSESDPVFTASAASGIKSTDITNWNNKGTYSKPSGGIPKSDLAQSVQTSLGKADTALQGFTESDPTVPQYVKNISETNISNWNTHVSNSVIHVTSTDKANWNGKLDAPTGGTEGQILTKKSDGTAGWEDAPKSGIQQETVGTTMKIDYLWLGTEDEIGGLEEYKEGVVYLTIE